MITKKIESIFKFIEFLHSNIDNFKQYDEAIAELHVLNAELFRVNPGTNFKDKLKYEKLQAEIEDKIVLIENNIIAPIKNKAIELNIGGADRIEDVSSWTISTGIEAVWSWNISDIKELKKTFSNDDLTVILEHKQKYLEYRSATKDERYFKLFSFFGELEYTLLDLFNFFEESKAEVIPLVPIEQLMSELESNIKSIPPPEPKDTLSNLITHENGVKIVEKIKIQYKNIKGKRLKLLLLAFQDLDLLPKERIAEEFHRRCKKEFDWNVASYNAMNVYKPKIHEIKKGQLTDIEELNGMKQYIEKLIKTD